MSLSKQLYIIITFIFIVIFSGNFFISVKNMKEYLEVEASTKAQDTATSLGMSIRPLIKDRTDPEIQSIIRAISNSGFYKEVRLEDANFIIKESELIGAAKELDDSNWKVEKVSMNPRFGFFEKLDNDKDISEQLLKLENEEADLGFEQERVEDKYKYVPSEMYARGGDIFVDFTASNGEKKVNSSVKLTIEKVLFTESRDVKFEYVPSWFINMIPIELEEKTSEISDGWNTAAIIYVSPNPGEAYAKLYEQAKNSIIYAVIALILSMIFLLIFVQFLLKPLKRIELLAIDISKGKFGTIAELPWTTEIKNVAIAMNDMSRKIEAIINKLNRNLDTLSKKLSEDGLTKLALKQTFETDMKNMFIEKRTGYVFNVKIHNLADYAKKHTHSEINDLITKFADILKNAPVDESLEVKAYRFYGSEFAMIIRNCDYEKAIAVSKKLKVKFEELGEEVGLDEVSHMGATPFNQYGTTPEMLQAANEAFEKAKLIGPNEFHIRDSNDLSRDMEAWRELIFEIIDNGHFDVGYINDAYTLNEDEKKLVMQEAFTNARDKENNSIPIGTFVSIAEKYDKIADLDKKVVSKVIDHIIINSVPHDISINLSLDSIANASFISWLQDIIRKNDTIASQLVFSVTAYGVAKDIDAFKKFCDEIHSCGGRIIIKRYESKFIETESVKEMNLDFIRLAREYTNSICEDKSKKAFVESINELASLLNIKVFAENVKDDKDLETIRSIKLHGASR